MLVKFTSFLGALHWAVRGDNLGGVGVSYLELLILFELWADERLVLKKAISRGNTVYGWASDFSVGCSFGWRSCMFFGWMFRFLRSLLGVLGRFMPCETGGTIVGFFGYPRDCGADLLEGFFAIAVLQG